MNCSEALDLVTPAVDGKLSPEVDFRLQEHFAQCESCRSEFEVERITKRFFKERIRNVPVPPDVLARVRSGIAAASSPARSPLGQMAEYLFHPTWKTFSAAAAVTAAVLLLVLIPFKPQHSHARPLDGNIINQTYNNFGEVIKGTMAPAISSEDPSVVKSYIDARAGFSSHVPRLKHCKLVGGGHTNYYGENIAHVIYQRENNFVYVYQVPLRSVMAGRILHLPDSVMRQLAQGGWYSEKQCAGCSLVVWTADSAVCCAIADVDKGELAGFIRENQ